MRYVAMFSANSEKGAKAAAQIELLAADSPAGPRLPAEHPPDSPPKKEIVMPPGVKDPRKEEKKEPKEVRSSRFEFDSDDVPDVSERRVTTDVPEEQLNQPGSYEAIMARLGQMKG